MSLPETSERVRESTTESINRKIDATTEANIEFYRQMPKETIIRRLEELDDEWDVERTLETNAACVGLAGLALGAFFSRKFLVVPAVVALFLLQHALQGWCPPLPLFRRLGIRTCREIDDERYA